MSEEIPKNEISLKSTPSPWEVVPNEMYDENTLEQEMKAWREDYEKIHHAGPRHMGKSSLELFRGYMNNFADRFLMYSQMDPYDSATYPTKSPHMQQYFNERSEVMRDIDAVCAELGYSRSDITQAITENRGQQREETTPKLMNIYIALRKRGWNKLDLTP
jgi:hypothetical protein